MKTKFNGFLTLLLAFVVQLTFAQSKTISGTVSDKTGSLPGVSVIIKGTTTGTETDFDGHYSITANIGDVLQYSFVGKTTVEKTVGASNTINVTMEDDANVLDEVVITTARNIKEKPRDVPYASQALKGEDLTIGRDNNLKTALNGKIAGVQVAAQSGAKLGSSGKVYLRGAISATGRNEALYIVDGVETSPENVDMDNIASINVLKGPSAVGLYGLRGADGVIVITTKRGEKGKVAVELFNNTTFENAAYFMDFQNEYGQGGSWGDANFSVFDYNAGIFGGLAPYPTEWAPLDGGRYMGTEYVDESWGPKFDGQPYIPWYAWWPGTADNPNPYYGKTIPYTAQPNNIKDYYNTGVTTKSGFAISGGGDKATARLSYSRTNQTGILPNSDAGNDNIVAKFEVNITDKLTAGVNATYNTRKWNGNFADTYGTSTSANFNQWFGRNLDVNKMKELKDLKTLNGHSASWNWWGPDLYGYGQYFGENTSNGDFTKPTFWFNPYYESALNQQNRKRDRFSGAFNINYKINDQISVGLDATDNNFNYNYTWKIPYELQYNSAFFRYHDAYINSFSTVEANLNTVIVSPHITYDTNITDDLDLNIYLGAESKNYKYNQVNNFMTTGGSNPYTQGLGLVIPDLFSFGNSRETIKPDYGRSRAYKSKSVFSRVKIGYKNFLTFTGDITNVWDSRYDIVGANNKNSFIFGSAGLAFVFSELMKNEGFLDFGKARISYGKVGTETSAYKVNPSYFLSSTSYNSNPTLYTPSTAPNPNVHPAASASVEGGIDLRMFNNKISLSTTYFSEHRTDEILNSETSSTTGVNAALVNAGDVKREGFEVELGVKAVKTDNFKWNIDFNWSNPKTTVLRLADGQTRQLIGERSIEHRSSFGVTELTNLPGQEWGQLVGNAIKRDASGTPVLDSNGMYNFEQDHNFGSVLPDFVGGVVNSFNYKGFTLTGSIAFQKGGKFFTLSEWWGTQTGLINSTVGNNDLGNPVRDAVSNGGGVHVVGVDNGGAPVDMYVEAHNYFAQYYNQRIAEPFIHDASYIKLSDLSLSYSFPKKVLGNALQGATIGVIARNLGMIAVSKENKQNWDPSELTYAWGEDGGLPGTRSIGFNVKLTF